MPSSTSAILMPCPAVARDSPQESALAPISDGPRWTDAAEAEPGTCGQRVIGHRRPDGEPRVAHAAARDGRRGGRPRRRRARDAVVPADARRRESSRRAVPRARAGPPPACGGRRPQRARAPRARVSVPPRLRASRSRAISTASEGRGSVTTTFDELVRGRRRRGRACRPRAAPGRPRGQARTGASSAA